MVCNYLNISVIREMLANSYIDPEIIMMSFRVCSNKKE